VPQNHRLAQLDWAKATVVKIMQIRATNAPRLRLDQHLPRAWFKRLAAFNPQVAGSMDHNG